MRDAVRELLRGLVDMHLHGTPSAAGRVETWDVLREMDEAGYRAVCLKEHFLPTGGVASTIARAWQAPRTRVVGSVVLNNAVGGLNLAALDAAAAMGARQVFLPTVSARNHCEYLKSVSSFGGGSLSVPEKPIWLLDEAGAPVPELQAVAAYLKGRPELTLSMGHLSPGELEVLVPYLLEFGLKKVVIDHPFFIIGASLDQVARWSGLGAYINFTCSSLEGIGKNGHVPLEVLRETLRVVPEDRLVISTDFGQPYNGSPVEGMRKMLQTLLCGLHVPEERVWAMTHTLPARLLDLDRDTPAP